jgi:excisionase family DNA binding protein
MRASGATRVGSFVVAPGSGRMARRELIGRLEQRAAAAARELEAIREDISRMIAVGVSPLESEPQVAPRLLTVSQAAVALGLGESTVHGLIRSGELGSRKIGGAHRVPVAELDAFVAGLAAGEGGC